MSNGRPVHSLISSDRVKKTAVFTPTCERIGEIDHMMIDKISGRVAWVVMRFGGLFGLGNRHFPLPWDALSYDVNLGGYVTEVTESQLRKAPEYTDASFSDPEWEQKIRKYYAAASTRRT